MHGSTGSYDCPSTVQALSKYCPSTILQFRAFGWPEAHFWEALVVKLHIGSVYGANRTPHATLGFGLGHGSFRLEIFMESLRALRLPLMLFVALLCRSVQALYVYVHIYVYLYMLPPVRDPPFDPFWKELYAIFQVQNCRSKI